MGTRTTLALIVVFFLSVGVSMAGFALINTEVGGTGSGVAVGSSGEVEALKTRIAMLEEQVEALKKKAAQKVYTASRDNGRPRATLKKINPKPDAAGGDVNPEVLDSFEDIAREQFEKILEEKERAEEAEREREREEWRENWKKEQEKQLDETYNARLEKMREELALTPSQVDGIRDLFAERREGIIQQRMQRWNRDLPDDERIKWEDIDKRFQEGVASILTQTQLEDYKKKRLGSFGGRGWRGRGRRSGG